MCRTDDVWRTLISIHLMLAAGQQCCLTLTLAKLWTELAIVYIRMELPWPKEWNAPIDSDTPTTYSPVPISAISDGVDVKFEASMFVDVFPLVFAWVPRNPSATTSVARNPLARHLLTSLRRSWYPSWCPMRHLFH